MDELEMKKYLADVAAKFPDRIDAFDGMYFSDMAVSLAEKYDKPIVIVGGKENAMSVIFEGYPAVGAPWADYVCAEWMEPFAGRDTIILGNGGTMGKMLINSVFGAAEKCEAINHEKWMSQHAAGFMPNEEKLNANELLKRGLLSDALDKASDNLT